MPGRPVRVYEPGERYGRLVVIERRDQPSQSVRCRCDCGTRVVVAQAHYLGRHTRSCGCLSRDLVRERSTSHGMSRTRIYSVWRAMVSRCTKPQDKNYHHYGGRGISVCDWWLDFANFLADMGEAPPGRSLDRIDNDGNYEPGNCRWATSAEQHANRRLHLVANARKTHCKHGHPFNEENTRVCPDGRRACRTCAARASREKRIKQKHRQGETG